MNEWIELFKDAAVIGALIYALSQFINTYQQRKSKEKQSAELVLDISTTARNVAEGGETAVEAMTRVLTIYENRIKELETVQVQRTAKINELIVQIEALTNQIEGLNREYTREMTALQDKYNALKAEYSRVLQLLKDKGIDYESPLLDTGKHDTVNK